MRSCYLKEKNRKEYKDETEHTPIDPDSIIKFVCVKKKWFQRMSQTLENYGIKSDIFCIKKILIVHAILNSSNKYFINKEAKIRDTFLSLKSYSFFHPSVDPNTTYSRVSESYVSKLAT